MTASELREALSLSQKKMVLQLEAVSASLAAVRDAIEAKSQEYHKPAPSEQPHEAKPNTSALSGVGVLVLALVCGVLLPLVHNSLRPAKQKAVYVRSY